MIVQCKAIYNQTTKEYLNVHQFDDLSVGYHYNVLEINITNNGVVYRINPDGAGLASCSFLVLAKDFEIITNNIPKNWALCKEHAQLSPYLWTTDTSRWEFGFWHHYFEDLPEALACYRSEIKTIVAADKDYIQIMIDERSDTDRFYTWQDTMLPLFAEVLAGK